VWFDGTSAFWSFVKESLNVHEVQRYAILHNISTDIGRGRAWLRASLNERTLERALLRLTSSRDLIQYVSLFYCARQHICYSAHMLSPVRPSVTRVDQSKTVEVRIMQFSPLSSPMTLVSSWLTSQGRQIREG